MHTSLQRLTGDVDERVRAFLLRYAGGGAFVGSEASTEHEVPAGVGASARCLWEVGHLRDAQHLQDLRTNAKKCTYFFFEKLRPGLLSDLCKNMYTFAMSVE